MSPDLTAADIADGAAKGAAGVSGPATALRDLSEAFVEYATAKVSQKADDWTHKLNAVAAPDGATNRAAYEGVKASLAGKNPFWAALRGAWSGASAKVKAAEVLALVLVLVVAPVPTLLILLGLLVAAIVAGVRSAAR
jgi:hypothetical protein